MAPANRSIRSAIEHELTRAIDTAIAGKCAFESVIDIRTIAVETLQQICQAWSTESQRYDGTQRTEGEVVDRLHLTYTAAQRLFRYRDLPEALRTQVVTCLTGHVVRVEEVVTVGLLKEILHSALKVQMAQTKKIQTEERATVESQRIPAKSEAASQGARDADQAPKTPDVAPQPVKKKSKGKAPASDGTLPSPDREDAKDEQSAVEDDPGSAAVTAPSNDKATLEGSAAKTAQKPGPGNFTKEAGVKWYPDEDQFMMDLIVANPKWTYKQYAEANTTHFKGTYYTDVAGEQQPGMRGNRTTNAVRLRFAAFKMGLSKQAGEDAKNGGGNGTTQEADAVSGGANAYAAATIIYASGKMGSVAEFDFTGGDDETRSEVGEDENPLEDLEEMVDSVMVDTGWESKDYGTES